MKLIAKLAELQAAGGTVVSFEFFPAKNERAADNLLARVEEMAFSFQPTFVTMTFQWPMKDLDAWIEMGRRVQDGLGLDIVMHLTCHLPVGELKDLLARLRAAGIHNLLALRGDAPVGQTKWRACDDGLCHAVDLVRLIREEHGDYFCVGVAGYPETHVECWNSPDLPPSKQSAELDLSRLKEKIDAGADFVISQFFYEPEAFLSFQQRCRAMGIKCPILPGIMPIHNYDAFCKFTSWCRTRVPRTVKDNLRAVKDNDDAVSELGSKVCSEICRSLLEHGVQALHFYTLNQSAAVSRILEELGMVHRRHERALPFRMLSAKSSTEVRPIFWANRTASYTSGTTAWNAYPNGRWGDASNPAFGEISQYYLAHRPHVDGRVLWGVPQSEQDVQKVFLRYLGGEVAQIPWCDQTLASESSSIMADLTWMNENGFWTINSQPRVNALPSTDSRFGWGGEGGYVFQKAYVEFFVSPVILQRLMTLLPSYPSLTYHALNVSGKEFTNADPTSANAVTWGVFPDREILQPTIVDPVSFRAWKDEAFSLWLTQWRDLYTEDSKEDGTAREVLQRIHDTYYLVNVVDNAFAEPSADIFAVFKELVTTSMSAEELRRAVRTLHAKNAQLREQSLSLIDVQSSLQSEVATALRQVARLEAENATLRSQVLNSRVHTIMSRADRVRSSPTL